MDLPSLTISRIRQGLLAREFSAVELAREALDFAAAENPNTNAYLLFSPERALEAAARVDEKLARGEDPGALAGVPVAVKDVIVTKGVRTTCGSKTAGGLRSALRCHRNHAPRRGRRRHSGQDQLRRIRDGIVERKFGVRAGAQSAGARPRAGRIERWLGCRRGAGHR